MNLSELGWNPYFENQINNQDTNPDSIARVTNVQKNLYRITGKKGEIAAKLSGSFIHHSEEWNSYPVVGDWVLFNNPPDSEYAIIEKILERQNVLSRGAAGTGKSKHSSSGQKQVIVSNVDTVFIVCGLDRDFNLRRIERYLTIAYDSQTMPVVVLSKSDLADDPELNRIEVEEIAFGVPILLTNVQDPESVDSLRHYLTKGRTATLVGSSGVGKSTIINMLLGTDRQKTSTVSDHVNKGRHTTTTRELIVLPEGGIIIDTPGMRELQVTDCDDGFSSTFEDIEQLSHQCRFSDCSHTTEPGCAVLEAVEEGDLNSDHLSGYHKLRKELDFELKRSSKSTRVIEKEKWRKIKIAFRKSSNPKH